MHSKIIQIETNPVDETEYIEPDYYYDTWFVSSIADYVAEDDDRKETIEWFKEHFTPAMEYIEFISDENGEGFILREGFHTAFFTVMYSHFDKCLKELSEAASAAAYSRGDLDGKMYAIKEAYDDKHGFYVQGDKTGLSTLYYFLRYTKVDTPYYFGGTVDYHW